MRTVYHLISAMIALLVLSWTPDVYGQQRSTVSPFGHTPDVSTRRGDHFDGDKFARTELYFGTAKPDGSAVNEEEFALFLDQVITPLFPEGLTLVSALGQFLGSAG